MFNRNSPLKRKHTEFHDPDYPQQDIQSDSDDGKPGCSANFSKKRRKTHGEVHIGEREEKIRNEINFDKVRQVIEKEFQREIVIKQQQLEEIDNRLKKAKHLLDRLRYAIVSDYYKKQDISITSADAAAIRGPNCLFDREDKGPQMPLHPSLKKLIGKRPRDLSDVMRTCPKRAAAQNAVQTIRGKSDVQKKEERKLKKIIRNQGIVIDHSKQNAMENDITTLLNEAAVKSLNSINNAGTAKQENAIKEYSNEPSGKSLNSARLNNKIKHFIVVGNTSKYIGNELERDVKSGTKNVTHKWLVYVQSKETNDPLERFVKKVRFHLHPSYRPNDVVDIESSPFQISRRGWGEFPIRVQLFFHPEFHQKPVQLIHNIILDQTFSGIETLGAETLLEIWLRDIKTADTINKEKEDTKPNIDMLKQADIAPKPKANITTHSEELVDDNLLDFLNKIEATPCSISADIEKIQPTVLVNEPLEVKIKTPSPESCKIFKTSPRKSPIKTTQPIKPPNIPVSPLPNTSNLTSNSIVSTAQCSTLTSTSTQIKRPLFTNDSLVPNSITTFVCVPNSTTPLKFIDNPTTAVNKVSQTKAHQPIAPLQAQAITTEKSLTPSKQNSSLASNKDGKIVTPSASAASVVQRAILPIVNSTPTSISTTTAQMSQNIITINKPKVVSLPSATSSSSSATKTMTFNVKQILQKKLVQLIDSTGKVKYIQMLVAASSPSTVTQNLNTSSAAPKLVTVAPSLVKNNTVTNTTQSTNTVTTPLAPNGVRLMPAQTMKPNIFKIVPESMQTKPQILTFNVTTSMAANVKNTVTTANIQQQLQHTKTISITTTTTAATQQITVPLIKTMVEHNDVTAPVANKLQKLISNNSPTTIKNVVFQKEGKLCIIDPQQKKYKQQQKNQVSLLKPQISLLKQQQQQKPITSSATFDKCMIDAYKPNNNVPQIHFGLKQQRLNSINALQLLQMERMVFEKQFLRQEFTNIRSAVEYLLRRLKLIASKDSSASYFPFVCHTLNEFQSLTAFKQRSFEWLRAKNISRLIRNHKDLQRLNSSSKETFWSTKEIAIFARQYAYTPPIKSLPKPGNQQQADENSTKGFMDLVKSELKQEHNVQYDTLTDNYKMRKWINKIWHNLEDYEHYEEQDQIIDIESTEEQDNKIKKKIQTLSSTNTCNFYNNSLDAYLAPPPYLENECQLVTDICKALNIMLVNEEIDVNIFHPTTLTILAQCLHLFIEKVLRQTVAFKQTNSALSSSVIESVCTLMPQDFAKVFASNSEFDFLTNNSFGSAALAEPLDTPIKPKQS